MDDKYMFDDSYATVFFSNNIIGDISKTKHFELCIGTMQFLWVGYTE